MCAYKRKEIVYHPFPNLEQKSDSSESVLAKVIYYQVNWYVSSLKSFLFLPLINFISKYLICVGLLTVKRVVENLAESLYIFKFTTKLYLNNPIQDYVIYFHCIKFVYQWKHILSLNLWS